MSAHEHFEVGEVAILLWCPRWPEYPQCECTVIGARRLGRVSYTPSGWPDLRALLVPHYLVVCADGSEWCATAGYLRKKRPPQDWVSLCALDKAEEPA